MENELNELNEIEKEIIIGVLLGDGYLNLTQGKEAYLEIKQSKEKLSYVEWLHSQLERLGCTKIYQRKDNLQWYFRSQELKCLTRFKEIFYRDKRKIVPLKIKRLLTSPLSLAVWYMDDGNIDFRPKYHYSYVISINSFTFKEAKLLVETLNSNFGLRSTVNRTTCR
ncbi:MAG: hypothetical protein QME57_05430 [Patescibacteria group bacterium]|nr:hypothetical protein [Patescibacteria group bacterium]